MTYLKIESVDVMLLTAHFLRLRSVKLVTVTGWSVPAFISQCNYTNNHFVACLSIERMDVKVVTAHLLEEAKRKTGDSHSGR